MNFVSRGLLNITRNVKKSIIFFIVVALLGTLASGAIITERTLTQTAERLRMNASSAVAVNMDWEEMENYQLMYGIPPNVELMTQEMIKEIGSLSYVKDFDYTFSWFGHSTIYEYEPEVEVDHSIETTWEMGMNGAFGLIGVSNPRPIQFEEGLFSLSSGRLFTDSELQPNVSLNTAPVLISEEVATLNNLQVGDVVNIYQTLFSPPEDADIPPGGFVGLFGDEIFFHPYHTVELFPHEFEIIGIFEIDHLTATDMDYFFLQSLLYNDFFIPNWKVVDMIEAERENQQLFLDVFPESQIIEGFLDRVGVFWVLEDMTYLEEFRQSALNIMPEFYMIEDSSQFFEPMDTAVGALNQFAHLILLFSSISILIILTLLVMLYLNDRRQEIGLYLAMGESKLKVSFQILFEVLLVSIIGFTISLSIGHLLSQQVSQELLLHELRENQLGEVINDFEVNRFSNLEHSGMGRQLSAEELADLFNVRIDMETTISFYAIGLGAVVLSTLIPIGYIYKLSPKKILM